MGAILINRVRSRWLFDFSGALLSKMLVPVLLVLPIIAILREHPFYSQLNLYARHQVYVFVPRFLEVVYNRFFVLWTLTALLFSGTAIWHLNRLANWYMELNPSSSTFLIRQYRYQWFRWRSFFLFGALCLGISIGLAVIL